MSAVIHLLTADRAMAVYTPPSPCINPVKHKSLYHQNLQMQSCPCPRRERWPKKTSPRCSAPTGQSSTARQVCPLQSQPEGHPRLGWNWWVKQKVQLHLKTIRSHHGRLLLAWAGALSAEEYFLCVQSGCWTESCCHTRERNMDEQTKQVLHLCYVSHVFSTINHTLKELK